MKKYILPIVLFGMVLWALTGCGKNAELEAYKTNMNQFFENIRILNDAINGIDPNSETATSELLGYLDSMNTSFEQMASLTVPDGFPGVAELSADASSYMKEAVSYYHQAYDGEYDGNAESIARQNYEFANVRFQYIVSIIHGDIPEEIYTYEDDSEGEISENESIDDENS